MPPAPKPDFAFRRSPWFLAALVVGAGLLGVTLFRGGNIAFIMMDAPALQFRRLHESLRGGFVDVWFVEPWLGCRYWTIPPDPNLLFHAAFSFPWSPAVLVWWNLLLGGLGMYVLLRSFRLVPAAAAIGGLAYTLTNNVVTLVYAGHLNKLITYAWIPWSMTFFLRGLRGGKFRNYVISGAFFGLGLLGGEVQILYYLGLWYVVWLALELWEQHRAGELNVRMAAKNGAGLAAMAVCALVLGLCATHHYWQYLVVNTPVVGEADTPQNWLFATQYFFPPEEVLSFFTTIQFFGAPFAYWGRVGSPTPLRLSDDYLGILPLGFAILGGMVCWRIWQARLFVFMALGSLLISFGREGGLFWLLYQLPTMKAQRNPHRWTYFVALATCVLAAYGVNWLLSQLRSTLDARRSTSGEASRVRSPQRASNVELQTLDGPPWGLWKRGLAIGIGAGAVLFAASGLLLQNARGVAEVFYGAAAMTSPQGPLFAERARDMLFALTRTGFFLALSAGAVGWVIRTGAREIGGQEAASGKRRGNLSVAFRSWLPWLALLFVLVADLGSNAKRYIVFYPWRQVLEENPLANFLRQDQDLFRVKALGVQQNPILNNLVSNILPYHRIPVVDPPAASRIPNDYGALFRYFEQHYVRSDRYYDFFNVKYVLSPGAFADPNASFVLVAQWNGINVYRRENGLPRAWLTSAACVASNEEEALAATLHPLTDLRQTVVLEEAPQTVPVRELRDARQEASAERRTVSPKLQDEAVGRPSRPPNLTGGQDARPPAAPNAAGVVRMTHYEDERIEVETEAAKPAVLVFGDKWDPDWKAWVDGAPARILKANFLMRGVELPAGKHSVRMEYRPSMLPFKISAGGVLLFAAYGLWRGARLLARRP
ncbi:MAG: YfhO family protein [Verrucomicrobiae bacterium]|nr:YfhO family protein [Verrucomicrobiae bacterium]